MGQQDSRLFAAMMLSGSIQPLCVLSEGSRCIDELKQLQLAFTSLSEG